MFIDSRRKPIFFGFSQFFMRHKRRPTRRPLTWMIAEPSKRTELLQDTELPTARFSSNQGPARIEACIESAATTIEQVCEEKRSRFYPVLSHSAHLPQSSLRRLNKIKRLANIYDKNNPSSCLLHDIRSVIIHNTSTYSRANLQRFAAEAPRNALLSRPVVRY